MQLDTIARRVGEEGLAAQPNRYRVGHLEAETAQTLDRRVDVVDEECKVLAPVGRHGAFDEVHLLAARVEPSSSEPEVRPVRPQSETKHPT